MSETTKYDFFSTIFLKVVDSCSLCKTYWGQALCRIFFGSVAVAVFSAIVTGIPMLMYKWILG